MPLSMPILHEPRAGELRDGVDHDEHAGRRERPPVRSQQDAEQRAAPAAQEPGESGARLVDVLGRDAAPRVDPRVAGQVERPVELSMSGISSGSNVMTDGSRRALLRDPASRRPG